MLASQAAISMENAEHFHDVQQARDQARQWGEELRRYFDNLPVMAWQNSADGALEFANKQWHDYTGSSPDDDPLEVWSYFHPDDREQVAERWRHLLAFRVSGEIEARMRRSDGQYRRFLVRAQPLLDETGAILKWHGTNTDIEDIKRAEEVQHALARVSRIAAMGELTVSIAHEVNQPLMAIVTNAATCLRWLAPESPNLPEARLAAERIVRDGHRAGDVVASIRGMARKGSIQFVEVDLNGVITEVLMLARNELQRHGIAVETHLAAEADKALGDRIQIQQVVLNLVVNGIEAMTAVDTASRRLVVRSENLDGGFVEASVSDSGHGLDPNDADRVFDAFFTTKTDGLGMGLSICRSIVENHGGHLVVSANFPQGCTFSVQLPVAGGGHSVAGRH
jgi:PAS domain S-box-containing protein